MPGYVCVCNTLDLKKVVIAETEPETCPVDGCSNFICMEEK